MTHPTTATVLALSLSLFVLTGCETDKPPAPQTDVVKTYEEGVPGGEIVEVAELTAKVKKVDKATRKVTLLEADGSTSEVVLGPEVKNFDQIAAGDQVKLRVANRLVVFVDSTGAMTDTAAGALTTARKGDKPGVAGAKTVQRIGKLVGVDHDKRTATVQFADGVNKTFKVRDDIDLANQQIGMHVVFQLTEMVAVNVQKP